MFIIHLGYQSFAVPNEYAPALYEVIAVMQPLKSEGYGNDRKYQYDDEPLDINVVKIDSKLIQPMDLPKEEISIEETVLLDTGAVFDVTSGGEGTSEEKSHDYSILDCKMGDKSGK